MCHLFSRPDSACETLSATMLKYHERANVGQAVHSFFWWNSMHGISLGQKNSSLVVTILAALPKCHRKLCNAQQSAIQPFVCAEATQRLARWSNATHFAHIGRNLGASPCPEHFPRQAQVYKPFSPERHVVKCCFVRKKQCKEAS